MFVIFSYIFPTPRIFFLTPVCYNFVYSPLSSFDFSDFTLFIHNFIFRLSIVRLFTYNLHIVNDLLYKLGTSYYSRNGKVYLYGFLSVNMET